MFAKPLAQFGATVLIVWIALASAPEVRAEPLTPAPTPAPTYCADVAPILQRKCQGCHRAGQIGPFALMSYADAKRWSATMAEVVRENRMPPWHAAPEVGTFSNDRSLTPAEKTAILTWIEQGTPLGDASALPAPRKYPTGPWAMGTPDAVYRMKTPFSVPASGTIDYQWFVVPTDLTEDRWIEAVEIQPGNPRVVHHILAFVGDGSVSPREAIRNHAQDGDEGAGGGHLAGWVPGDEPTVFPSGTGKLLPAGSVILFQVHYTPNGKAETDQSALAVKFAKSPPEREVRTVGITNANLEIPAGANHHEVRSSMRAPADIRLINLWPHMHLRGKDFFIQARYPNNAKPEPLLRVPNYDFNWQTTYALATPKILPRGTTVECIAHFDNSAENPNNPNPKIPVGWGAQTTDEMMIAYVDYVFVRPEDAPVPRGKTKKADPQARIRTAFDRLDRNGDDQLTREEFPNPQLFNRADLNKNGVITREEAKTLAPLLEKRKRPQ